MGLARVATRLMATARHQLRAKVWATATGLGSASLWQEAGWAAAQAWVRALDSPEQVMATQGAESWGRETRCWAGFVH